jgi:snurportin-1
MLDPGILPNAISSFQHDTFPQAVDPQKDFKKKSKRKNKKRSNKPSEWADKCMYAELLEMSADAPWCSLDGTVNDGLPNDLESAWVAVAPVPAGKRCLAVTHQSSGVAGVGTSLARSRI